jgi:hypothetical protein
MDTSGKLWKLNKFFASTPCRRGIFMDKLLLPQKGVRCGGGQMLTKDQTLTHGFRLWKQKFPFVNLCLHHRDLKPSRKGFSFGADHSSGNL